MIKRIPLEQIDPNPWQPRQSEDAQHIEQLAMSIKSDGLMQIPSGREMGDRVQLAFGHSRLAAIKSLRDGLKTVAPDVATEWDEMPVNVVDLNDEQMFQQAVAENVKRRDLNPVELARAMQRYSDDFHKTSAEIGELFGVSDATVRGTVRLLDLPERAKDKLASGEMSVAAARRLLTVQRVVGEKEAEKVAKEISDPSADVDGAIASKLRQLKGVEMWGSWRDQGTPLAGMGLWPLGLPKDDFPQDLLPELKKEEAFRIFEWENKDGGYPRMYPTVLKELTYDPKTAQKYIDDGWDVDVIEKTVHLIDPPACTACPFYARMDKMHYCAFPPCHKRKIQAWGQAELAKLAKKLDLLIYEPAVHGKQIWPLKRSWNDEGKTKKIFDARTDICLRVKYNSSQGMYGEKHDCTDSFMVEAIAVGKVAKKQLDKREAARDAEREREGRYEQERRRSNLEWENRRHSSAFLEKVAAPAFASAFVGIENIGALEALMHIDSDGGEKLSRAKKLEFLRCQMADRALDHVVDFKLNAKGPLAVAKHLQGVAITWGVQLPADWLELPQPYLEGLQEYENLDGQWVSVSAETAEVA